MHYLRISQHEFDEFREIQVNRGWPWPAVFSCTKKYGVNKVWPAIGRGWSREENRSYVEGDFPLLDQIVAIILIEREEGGRFFINENGVYIRPDEPHILLIQFIPE